MKLQVKRQVWLVVAVALALRLAALVATRSPAEAAGATPWTWGQEPACIADALLRGDGFSDPFGRDTGPSAWLTPPYPVLLAGLMQVFDGVGPGTARALFLLQALVSALTCPLIMALGRRLGRERAGVGGAWLFALHPLGAWTAIHRVWDTTFVAAGLLAVVVLCLGAGRAVRPRRAAGLGALFGALLMVNPAPLAVVPALLWFLCAGAGARRALAGAAAFGLGALAVCAPWMARNQRVLGTLGLRSNLGLELRVGNGERADGMHRFELHPGWNDGVTERLRAQGEVEFAAREGAAARRWIREHPGRFAGLTLTRARILWFGIVPSEDRRTSGGLVAAEDPRSWGKWIVHLVGGLLGLAGLATLRGLGARGGLVAAVILLFPLPYYAIHALERYRFPLDPLLAFLAAGVVLVAVDRFRGRSVGTRSTGTSREPSTDGDAPRGDDPDAPPTSP